jgi:hypothetical protein
VRETLTIRSLQMRLINVETFRLEEYFGRSIPRYSILSHTWYEDEVTFQDMQRPLDEIKQKEGFSKIRGCVEQTKRESLHYCWVDTCCIDKSSSSELTEAINSMYRWYRQSEVCFAYLSDVQLPTAFTNQYAHDSGQAFTESHWFSRGWTLQELIAPRQVWFFDRHWLFIDSRARASRQIEAVTNVPKRILEGESPSTTSVAQRMSWAARRETTRIEDIAYCLMGLFEVYMPLMYGEGMHAFLRLQQEIIKSSDDTSIFAWKDKSIPRLSHCGLLAQSPADFEESGNIVPRARYDEYSDEYLMTNRGLRMIFTEMIQVFPSGDILADLGCDALSPPNTSQHFQDVRIYIRQVSRDHFVRVDPDKLVFSKSLSPRLALGQYIYREKPLYFRQSSLYLSEHVVDQPVAEYCRGKAAFLWHYPQQFPEEEVMMKRHQSLVNCWLERVHTLLDSTLRYVSEMMHSTGFQVCFFFLALLNSG